MDKDKNYQSALQHPPTESTETSSTKRSTHFRSIKSRNKKAAGLLNTHHASNASHQHSQGRPKRTITEYGLEDDFKARILQAFPPDYCCLQVDEQFLETFGSIWSELIQKPLSLQPFSAAERRTVESGQIGSRPNGSVYHAVHNSNNYNTRYAAEPADSKREGCSSSDDKNAGNPRHLKSGKDASQSAKDQETFGGGGEAEEEDDVLWNIPVKGESMMGSFDSQGNFNIPGSQTEMGEQIETEPSLSTQIPGHDRLPPPGMRAMRAERIPSLPAKELQWYYQDPSGQRQGPFDNKKMAQWYRKKYFPDSLPLMIALEEGEGVERDFVPLRTWKAKCRDLCPFEVPEEAAMACFDVVTETIDGQSNGSNMAGAAGGVKKVGSKVFLKHHQINEKIKDPVARKTNGSDGNLSVTEKIFAKLGFNTFTKPSLDESRTAATNPAPITTRAKYEEEDEQEQGAFTAVSTSSAKKKSAHPTALQSDQISFLQTFSQQSSAPPRNIAEREFGHQASPAGRSIPIESLFKAAASVKPNAPVPREQTSPSAVIPVAAPAVAWSKSSSPTNTHASTAADFAEIMRKESEASAQSVQAKSRSPTTFADTLRNAHSSTTSINKGASQSSKTTNTTSIANKPLKNTTSSPQNNKKTAAKKSLEQWCHRQLAPLSAHYDLNVCVMLLMELRDPKDVYGFVGDNLRGGDKLDTQAFARSYVKRAFVDGVPVEDVEDDKAVCVEEDDDEFITGFSSDHYFRGRDPGGFIEESTRMANSTPTIVHKGNFIEWTPSPIVSMAMSPQGCIPLLALVRANGDIEVWDAGQSWSLLARMGGGERRIGVGINKCLWSACGAALVKDGKSPAKSSSTKGDDDNLAWSWNGCGLGVNQRRGLFVPRLFTVGEDGLLVEWAYYLHHFQVLRAISLGDGSPIVACAQSNGADAGLVVVGTASGSVCVYDLESGASRLLPSCRVVDGEIIDMALCLELAGGEEEDSCRMLAISTGSSIYIYCARAENGRIRHEYKLAHTLAVGALAWSLHWSPQAMVTGGSGLKSVLVASCQDGGVRFWDAQMGIEMHSLHKLGGDLLTVTGINGKIWAAGVEGKLVEMAEHMSGDRGKTQRGNNPAYGPRIINQQALHTHDVTCMALAPLVNGNALVISGSVNGEWSVYDPQTNKLTVKHPFNHQIAKCRAECRLLVAAIGAGNSAQPSDSLLFWRLGSVDGVDSSQGKCELCIRVPREESISYFDVSSDGQWATVQTPTQTHLYHLLQAKGKGQEEAQVGEEDSIRVQKIKSIGDGIKLKEMSPVTIAFAPHNPNLMAAISSAPTSKESVLQVEFYQQNACQWTLATTLTTTIPYSPIKDISWSASHLAILLQSNEMSICKMVVSPKKLAAKPINVQLRASLQERVERILVVDDASVGGAKKKTALVWCFFVGGRVRVWMVEDRRMINTQITIPNPQHPIISLQKGIKSDSDLVIVSGDDDDDGDKERKGNGKKDIAVAGWRAIKHNQIYDVVTDRSTLVPDALIMADYWLRENERIEIRRAHKEIIDSLPVKPAYRKKFGGK